MKIYFNLRLSSRERMWDTATMASKVYETFLPGKVSQKSSVAISKQATTFMSKIKYFLSKFLINKQRVDTVASSKSNILYFWGAFPSEFCKSFIIEIDNPYVLAYYNIENFNRRKKEILVYLQRAHKIVYLSNAAKQHTLELFNDDTLALKSIVQYPYVEKYYERKQRDEKIINFIFVGLHLRGKGGDELLKAFSKITCEHIRLTFISNVDKKIKYQYEHDKRIRFLPPQSRENLLTHIYPKMDVMVFPSFYESFGMVLLEALSFGMGIIATNLYATPEIVHDNVNGKLLHHPFIAPTYVNGYEIINCVEKKSEIVYQQYLKHNEFYYGLYGEIKEALEDAIMNYKEWQHNSEMLFDNTFSPHVWYENFKRIIGER